MAALSPFASLDRRHPYGKSHKHTQCDRPSLVSPGAFCVSSRHLFELPHYRVQLVDSSADRGDILSNEEPFLSGMAVSYIRVRI